jgi:hypothetical protein
MPEIQPHAGRTHGSERTRGNNINLFCSAFGPGFAHDGNHFPGGNHIYATVRYPDVNFSDFYE